MLRRPGPPLLAALGCLLGLAATGVVALLVPLALPRDSAALQGFVDLNRPTVTPLIDGIAHLADPEYYGAIGLGLALIALARRRVRLALVIPVVLVAAGATTTLLKPLLATPRYDEWLGDGQISAASWPSGHASASMTLGLLAILAVGPRWRPLVALVGAGFAVCVSYASLALGWHFPSDVVGGFFNAAMWVLLAVSLLAWLERRHPQGAPRAAVAEPVPWPRRPSDLPTAALLFGASLSAVGAATALVGPGRIADFALQRPAWTAGAGTIAALALALAALLARTLGGGGAHGHR